jgi:hypothetical protein
LNAQKKQEMTSIVNQLLDQRLSEFRKDPLDGNVIDDIPDDLRPRQRRRTLVQPLPNLPGMTQEASRDLGQRLSQWKRVSMSLGENSQNKQQSDPGGQDDPDNPSNKDADEKRRQSSQSDKSQKRHSEEGRNNERPGTSQERRPEHYRIRPANNEAAPKKFNEETEF